MTQTTVYDVAIIGSGIAGSALGAILAKQGLRVVIFEAKSHPRFAIGESLILETSEMMRALAHFYDVPELAYFSSENFAAYQGTTHGVKRHFGFLHHTAEELHQPQRTLQAVIPKEPHGYEMHLYRQDTDYFMMTTAVSYGATVLQNTAVQEIQIEPHQVRLIPPQGEPYTARYVVDAAGFRSPLAQKFNLRTTDLQTHSRALFTHMVDVPFYHEVMPEPDELPFRMSEGTLHHVFEGGWLWVIPFNNHSRATNPLCSVGLLLDPRLHPVQKELTAEAEFFSFIERFPSVAAQFKRGTAVREWVRTPGRIQYSSSQVVGDRWALLGHAAGFIDPLYSKGLYISLATVGVLADLLLQAHKTGDYSARAFAPLGRMTHNFIERNDQLVANSYRAFAHPDLWQVYAVQWLLGAYTELVKLNMLRAQWGHDRTAYFREVASLKLAGGGFAEFDEVMARVDGLIAGVDAADAGSVSTAVGEIKHIFRALDWIPDPFLALLDGQTTLPKNKIRLNIFSTKHGFRRQGAYRQHFFGDLSWRDLIGYGLREKIKHTPLLLSYRHRRQYQI